MKTKQLVIALLLIVCSCYEAPEIEGFNSETWKKSLASCQNNREALARLLMDNFAQIKGSSQNEIQLLLGKAERHQLFSRNQKFFFYNLTCPDSLGNVQQLRLRFDALGKLREANVELTESTQIEATR